MRATAQQSPASARTLVAAWGALASEAACSPSPSSHLSSIFSVWPGWHSRRHRTQLAYEEIRAGPSQSAAQPAHTVVILHGLLGSGRNWRSWSKALVERAAARQHAPWRAWLVDLRCHGASARLPGLGPPHSMHSAAEDVARLLHHRLGSHAAPLAILGHSMGGKVLLELLQQMASGLAGCPPPPQAWVLDSQPGAVPDDLDATTGVADVLQEVHSIPLPVPDRPWLMGHLAKRGFTPAIAQWLASNLVPEGRGGHGLTWAFNAAGAAAMYHSYRVSDYWRVCSHPPAGTTLHLVQGARSDRWPQPLLDRLEEVKRTAAAAAAADASPAAHTPPASTGPAAAADAPAHTHVAGRFMHHVLPDAGHWLQADNPNGLLDLVLPYLLAQGGRQQGHAATHSAAQEPHRHHQHKHQRHGENHS